MAEPQPQRSQPDPSPHESGFAGTPAKAALRRLQETLRQEMRSRSIECRYVAGCPVARAGACPGMC